MKQITLDENEYELVLRGLTCLSEQCGQNLMMIANYSGDMIQQMTGDLVVTQRDTDKLLRSLQL